MALKVMTLLALVLAASAAPAVEIVLDVEIVEASSITDLTQGVVTYSRTVVLGNEHRWIYSYEDPNDGRQYEIAFDFDAAPEAAGDTIKFGLDWTEQASGNPRLRQDNLAVDGSTALSLYRLEERASEVFLRLTPRLRRSAPAAARGGH